MSVLTAILLVAAVFLTGGVAIYMTIRPSLKNESDDVIVIAMADIAPIWMKHNTEIIPLGPGEIEKTGDYLDALWSNTEKTADPTTETKPEPQQPAGPLPVAEPAVITPRPTPGEKSIEAPPCEIKPPVENKEMPHALSVPAGLSDLNLSALEKPLISIWSDCIAPYTEQIKNQGAVEVIMTLLRLLEKHGHCPSVVIDKRDDESNDLISVRDNLVNTTLRDHTYSVCRYMVANMKKNIMDCDTMIPSALVMALGHDIGKIPEFRISGAYNAKDHTQVGANKLAEITQGINAFWVKKAINAVRDHHSVTKDDMTSMLKQADREARQAELITYTRSYQIKPFDQWFDLKKFLINYIAPGVNVDKTGKWNAFSLNGTIYAKPDWIHEQARRMCHEEKILDVKLVYISERESVLRMIVSTMRKENLTPLLGDNYYARKFEIKTGLGIHKPMAQFMTAFSAPDYINIPEIESRKAGFTELIIAVKPMS